MKNILPWILSHKIVIALSVVILFLLFKQQSIPLLNQSTIEPYSSMGVGYGSAPMVKTSGIARDAIALPSSTESLSAIDINSTNRMVTTDTWMSLVTKNTKETLSKIEVAANEVKGYMVSSDLSTPEEGGNGTIMVRVPKDKVKEVLESIRSFGIKVVDEHVTGQDVTDQFTDLEEHLAILERTKTKFETILSQATTVSDMLNVQRELISLQSQIDSIKGQQIYIKNNVEYSKITVYLSTDDLSLPYAPKDVWRPEVTFKLAVRALVSTVRTGVDKVIWIVVYAPIWAPIFLITYILYKKYMKK